MINNVKQNPQTAYNNAYMYGRGGVDDLAVLSAHTHNEVKGLQAQVATLNSQLGQYLNRRA